MKISMNASARSAAVAGLVALAGTSVAHGQWIAKALYTGPTFEAAVLNGSGSQQAGRIMTASGTRAQLWSGTEASIVDLHPAGAQTSEARGVSDGQQAGYASVGGMGIAVLWNGTATSWRSLHPSGAAYSLATGVSHGKQAGFAIFRGVQHAGVWSGTSESWVDLNPAWATAGSAAEAILGNQQVGYAARGQVFHACIWNGSSASFVDIHPSGNSGNSAANGTSGSQQVGIVQSSDSVLYHASLWSGSAASWVDLHPYGAIESMAYGVAGGRQVGYCLMSEGGNHAAVWSGTAESWVDITPPGYSNTVAKSIWMDANGAYYIGGYGHNIATGFSEALLWHEGAVPTDHCADAEPMIAGRTYTGTTVGATLDGSDVCRPSGEGPDVWYSYTPTCGGMVIIDTVGSSFDTVISAHTGCPGNTDNEVACNDDIAAGVYQSSMRFEVVTGATYKIRVAGYGGQSGQFVLHVNQGGPRNDDCGSALAVGSGSYNFETCTATTDGPDEGQCGTSTAAIHNDVWYTWVAECSRNAQVSTCGSDFDTKVAVYAGGCPTAPDTAIACNDDSCGYQSVVNFTAVAGHQYLIRVGGYGAATGRGTVTIGCTCPADFNQDGGVDGADVSAFFAAWEYGAGEADVNYDGGVDGEDVSVFFAAWENGGC
jgi:hypothetical protein